MRKVNALYHPTGDGGKRTYKVCIVYTNPGVVKQCPRSEPISKDFGTNYLQFSEAQLAASLLPVASKTRGRRGRGRGKFHPLPGVAKLSNTCFHI